MSIVSSPAAASPSTVSVGSPANPTSCSLPDGFHRIRHYGFLAKGDRGETLARVRDLLQIRPTGEPAAAREPQADEHARELFALCPDCGGLMRRIGHVAQSPAAAFRCDTS
jgi:hypothetical protein